MPQLRTSIVQTRRDAWVEINLGHIEHNIKILKNFISDDVKLLAVVKADAYGHGASMTAPTLAASGVYMFGVASVDEGIQLRQSGIVEPVLVLGSTPDWAITSATEHDIQVSIFTDEHINACIETYNRLKKKPQVQIKIDTGMNRIGLSYKNAPNYINKVLGIRQIELKGVFSHLACAECIDKSETQKHKWLEVIKNLHNKNILRHIANTSALISYKDLHFDMVRAGIGIYGLMPELASFVNKKINLKPAMGIKARIVYIKETEKDSGISYGHSFVTENEITKIATIPIGYADGIPRTLSNKIYGLINGEKIKQIGNITMDQMMFDISGIPNIKTGDIITLIGHDGENSIHIDEWANLIGTINYELTCRLKVRLPRVYVRD